MRGIKSPVRAHSRLRHRRCVQIALTDMSRVRYRPGDVYTRTRRNARGSAPKTTKNHCAPGGARERAPRRRPSPNEPRRCQSSRRMACGRHSCILRAARSTLLSLLIRKKDMLKSPLYKSPKGLCRRPVPAGARQIAACPCAAGAGSCQRAACSCRHAPRTHPPRPKVRRRTWCCRRGARRSGDRC